MFGKKGKQRLTDYQITFNSEHGKRVLADLCRSCYINQPIFEGETSSLQLAHREGQREVVLRILRVLKLDQGEIEQLMEEEEDEFSD